MRKDKIVNIVMSLIMIFVLIWFGVGVLGPAQDMQITEYCIENPEGSLQGDINCNCSDWLEGHPELVEKCMAIKKEIKEGEWKDEHFYN